MPSGKLKKFLDDNSIKYVKVVHSPAYTAQEIAAKAHIPGKELAKTIIVFVDGKMSMAVLPASYSIDFDYFRKTIGAKKIELATEAQFMDAFPDCELGSMPPFGNLYGMDVYVDQHLSEDEEIAFNAGTHAELYRLAYADFERFVKPRVVRLS